MNNWLKKCSQNLTSKKIAVSEQGKTFEIINSNAEEIIKTKVDDCLIDDQTKKCDYFFEVKKHKKQFFVELKGTNLKKAIEQIENTLKIFKQNYFLREKICGCIVLSRYPKMDTIRQTEEKRLQKVWRMKLGIQSQKMTIKL